MPLEPGKVTFDPEVIEAFKRGSFKEFERHSRLGMVKEESFMKRVEELRKIGAKYVFLKTGAYRPADLARAVKYASKAKIDLLTIDGAGGGTGMSPWRMMNEWGIPSVELWFLLYTYLKKLKIKNLFWRGDKTKMYPLFFSFYDLRNISYF